MLLFVGLHCLRKGQCPPRLELADHATSVHDMFGRQSHQILDVFLRGWIRDVQETDLTRPTHVFRIMRRDTHHLVERHVGGCGLRTASGTSRVLGRVHVLGGNFLSGSGTLAGLGTRRPPRRVTFCVSLPSSSSSHSSWVCLQSHVCQGGECPRVHEMPSVSLCRRSSNVWFPFPSCRLVYRLSVIE